MTPYERIYIRYHQGKPVAAYIERPANMHDVYKYFSKEYITKEAPRLAGRAGGFKAARGMTKLERQERARKAGLAGWENRRKKKET